MTPFALVAIRRYEDAKVERERAGRRRSVAIIAAMIAWNVVLCAVVVWLGGGR